MPVYEFKTDDGDVVELFMPFAEYDRRVKDGAIKLDDGRTANSFWNPKSLISTVPSCYPMVSEAAGVHPAQIKEQQAALRSAGVRTTHYTKDGNPIFEDKSHRREALTAMGMYDRNGGYSDPQPKVRTSGIKYR